MRNRSYELVDAFLTAARSILLNGSIGVVEAPYGRLFRAMDLTIKQSKITEINEIAELTRHLPFE